MVAGALLGKWECNLVHYLNTRRSWAALVRSAQDRLEGQLPSLRKIHGHPRSQVGIFLKWGVANAAWKEKGIRRESLKLRICSTEE